MYTHSPDPSKQYAILRKIRGSRDQAIPGYFAPQEQIPWVRGWVTLTFGGGSDVTKAMKVIGGVTSLGSRCSATRVVLHYDVNMCSATRIL
jgi:hypothetical protein